MRFCMNTLPVAGTSPLLRKVSAKPGCGSNSAFLLVVLTIWLRVTGMPCSA